jgi:hypothetical protein
MKLLIWIGIPFRFVMFLVIHVVVGLLAPDALPLDEDWKWVITGVDKYHRGSGRQLL